MNKNDQAAPIATADEDIDDEMEEQEVAHEAPALAVYGEAHEDQPVYNAYEQQQMYHDWA